MGRDRTINSSVEETNGMTVSHVDTYQWKIPFYLFEFEHGMCNVKEWWEVDDNSPDWNSWEEEGALEGIRIQRHTFIKKALYHDNSITSLTGLRITLLSISRIDGDAASRDWLSKQSTALLHQRMTRDILN